MMRKLLGLLAVVGFAVASTGSASAATFDPTESTLTVKLSGLASIVMPGEASASGLVQLVGRKGLVHLGGTVWTTSGLSPGTTLFTGVPLISNLKITAKVSAASTMTNQLPTAGFSPEGVPNPVGPGTIAEGPYGKIPVAGQAQVKFGGLGLVADLNVIGATNSVGCPGTGTPRTGCELTSTIDFGVSAFITLTGGPWVTGKIVMTNITTNIISIPDYPGTATGNAFTLDPPNEIEIKTMTTLGGFITDNPNGILKVQHQVTLAGTNNIIENPNTTHTARISYVAPMRITTVGLGFGNLPGQVRLSYKFVPEPAFIWLALGGAAGLALIGRSRMKK